MMKRILVVEDNKLERRLLVQFLISIFGKKAMIDDVSEGGEALSYLSNLEYHLVITDLVMPKVEGLELISKIKRNQYPCKIIAVSGSKPYYLHLAKKMGVQEVFTKPIDNEKFSSAVSELLD
jgi:YesN/AraC family two-component response regulator